MQTSWILSLILAYFGVLLLVAKWTSKNSTNASFFVGDRKSPWVLVAFGMIGSSLSGVTYLSIPGTVGNPAVQFSYMQVVLGYLLGYFVVALVLMPVYYRLQLTSIYEYLGQRFGIRSHQTGALFFFGSRVLGASVRLLLVANVLQEFLFDSMGIPFEGTVLASIALIWVYTNKGGIKTIIWTDTLQTAFMLAAVGLTVYFLSSELQLDSMVSSISESEYSKWFFADNPNGKNYFWKHLLGGMFITIGMTGLDQDMMQKNLSCKNIGDAKKNMLSFAFVLVLVNLLFLGLGALLYMYAAKTGVEEGVSGDMLFPTIALDASTIKAVGVLFFLGLIAAAYSSADSALTSLTTSLTVDFKGANDSEEISEKKRKRNHIVVSLILLAVILILKYTTSRSAIDSLLFFAGFTYGPLIALFFFGILTKRNLNDRLIPLYCFIGVGLTVLLWYFSAGAPGSWNEKTQGILGAYQIGYELIFLNAVLTTLVLYAVSTKEEKN